MSDNAVILPRGSELFLTCTWTDESGVAVDLTGLTLTAFEVQPTALQNDVSIVVTNATGGVFTIELPWSLEWPAITDGPQKNGLGPLVSLRIQSSNGAPLSVLIPVVLI